MDCPDKSPYTISFRDRKVRPRRSHFGAYELVTLQRSVGSSHFLLSIKEFWQLASDKKVDTFKLCKNESNVNISLH
jgi:hypothetical protein